MQFSGHNLRGCHSPHLHVRRSSVDHQLGLASPSSRSSAQASRIYAFATWHMKEVVRTVRGRRFPALQWMPPIVLRARSWHTPIRPQPVAKIKSMSPPAYVEPYLGDATERRRDVRGSSALSHHEINKITNRSYQYYFFVQAPSNRQKKPKFRTLEIIGRSHAYPRTSLSTFIGSPRHSSLTASAHLRDALLTYGIGQTLNNYHDVWVNWYLFY